MNRQAEELRKLKKDGIMVRTDEYVIMYNPFTDTFIMDVPEDKKILNFFIFDPKYSSRTYQWDMAGMYPYSVEAEGRTYEDIWKAMEPYSKGALTKLIPASYRSGMDDYIWINTDEDGLIAVKRSDIPIIPAKCNTISRVPPNSPAHALVFTLRDLYPGTHFAGGSTPQREQASS